MTTPTDYAALADRLSREGETRANHAPGCICVACEDCLETKIFSALRAAAKMQRENAALRERLEQGLAAANGALVLANCYFELTERDGSNNDNYCRLCDWITAAQGGEEEGK